MNLDFNWTREFCWEMGRETMCKLLVKSPFPKLFLNYKVHVDVLCILYMYMQAMQAKVNGTHTCVTTCVLIRAEYKGL